MKTLSHPSWLLAIVATVLLVVFMLMAWSRPAAGQVQMSQGQMSQAQMSQGLDQGEWQSELSAQMEEAEDCEVAFFSQVMESERDGRPTLTVKVHCLDKRAFDAHRHGLSEPFEIEECDAPQLEIC